MRHIVYAENDEGFQEYVKKNKDGTYTRVEQGERVGVEIVKGNQYQLILDKDIYYSN